MTCDECEQGSHVYRMTCDQCWIRWFQAMPRAMKMRVWQNRPDLHEAIRSLQPSASTPRQGAQERLL